MHDPGTNVPFTLESNLPPSVMTHAGSATTTYAPNGTGDAPDEPVRALRRLIHPLVNFLNCLFPPLLLFLLFNNNNDDSSSFSSFVTIIRARTRSPLTCVCTTSTQRPRSSLPNTGESRSGVSRKGRPPPKLIRYTPSGTGSVQGPESSSVALLSSLLSLLLAFAQLSSPSLSPLLSCSFSSCLAHCKLIHPSYLVTVTCGDFALFSLFLREVRLSSRDVRFLMLLFLLFFFS
mmetsp:Transcript_26403/g.56704  ORF Transcript_26403/g.56704 Transcript_26403/m.56704 type:complete len:233 (+) Transcript_26403:714-1412(+)